MPDKAPVLSVESAVTRTDREPVVVIFLDRQMIASMSPAQARNVARDIETQAARAEADAMIHRFFKKQEYPEGAAEALMLEFRKYRLTFDTELVDRSMSEPTLDQKKPQ